MVPFEEARRWAPFAGEPLSRSHWHPKLRGQGCGCGRWANFGTYSAQAGRRRLLLPAPSSWPPCSSRRRGQVWRLRDRGATPKAPLRPGAATWTITGRGARHSIRDPPPAPWRSPHPSSSYIDPDRSNREADARSRHWLYGEVFLRRWEREMTSPLSPRLGPMRKAIAPFVEFFTDRAWGDRLGTDPGCDFLAGNPQELALPGYVEAIRAASEPLDPSWFAYKSSERVAREAVAASL